MPLYASDSVVKKKIKDYTKILQCMYCEKIFTELDNVGTWQCRYHPGKLDFQTQRYTCCGQKSHLNSNHDGWARYVTWNETFDRKPIQTLGCTPCDHQARNSDVEFQDVPIHEIAQLIPFMKPPLEQRNFSVSDEPVLLRRCPVTQTQHTS